MVQLGVARTNGAITGNVEFNDSKLTKSFRCECRQDWYGKDCDYIDVGGSFTCQNPAGCHNAFGPPKVESAGLEEQAGFLL